MAAANAGVTELRQTIQTLAMDSCSSGRSAGDKQLQDAISTLSACRTEQQLLSRLFLIGSLHGQNITVRKLVQLDLEPNSYAAFCNRCGSRWAEHAYDGICQPKRKSNRPDSSDEDAYTDDDDSDDDT